jgi:endonuclease III
MSNLTDRYITLQKAIKFEKETMERLAKDFNYHNHEANRIQFTVEKLRAQYDEKQARLKELEQELNNIPTLSRQ